ncbi:putative oxidoreductase [Acidocella aminolytica 101 = DSM 11237]|jgi:putative oxidoreductase|nr:DoxX family protein [Acidocella aminolytica]SHE99438.1 putative oxidoreductase [Acidocella aminolytica 101 = DSM 11237]
MESAAKAGIHLQLNLRGRFTGMMKFGSGRCPDGAALLARLLLMLLFVIFGWLKLANFSGTIEQYGPCWCDVADSGPADRRGYGVFVGIALVLGIATRPLAILMLVYTLGTALIGHHFWTMTDMARFEAMINFCKNISIRGGLLLLYVTGAGKFSLDRVLGWN